MNHYFHYRRENVDFHYFLYADLIRSEIARFKGITLRRPPVIECMSDV